jgi:ribosomal protein S18 acetylase RimI-like enzyme
MLAHVTGAGAAGVVPRSLVWATDIDVLPADHVVHRSDDHLVVRSPSNPTHYWGNLLVFDRPPRRGDRARWEDAFAAEFADQPVTRHRTFGWDRTDDSVGETRTEFEPAGYELERTVGLVAAPQEIRPHRRANRDVVVRALRPEHGAFHEPADDHLWEQVVEMQVAGRDPDHFAEELYRAFSRRRLDDLRELFAVGMGSWYVALLGDQVVASCGVVVKDGRGRFQSVDTAADHRRRGICSRLVVEAAHDAAARHGAARLVIAADAEYHALGIYESLGFRPVERVNGVYLQPAEDRVAAGA